MMLFLKLLPILVSVLTFVLFRRIRLSLFFGVFSAALVLSNFSVYQTFFLILNQVQQSTQVAGILTLDGFWTSNRLQLLFFIVFLNIFISLLCKSGVVFGYYNFLNTRLKSKVGAELSCLVLGICLFIDDYLNVMMNSRVSTMFCSRFKISKFKIAFLVTCLAAPLCTIVPISSWTAEIIASISGTTFNTSYQGWDSFSCLLGSIPFMLTSFLWILMAFSTVLFKYSFGELADQEALALSSSEQAEEFETGIFSLTHFVFPIISVICSIACSMLYFAGYFNSSDMTIFAALKSNPFPEKSLMMGTLLATVVVVVVFKILRLLRARQFFSGLFDGLLEARDIIFLLVLSNTFARLINLLGTGSALAGLISLVVTPMLFPALSFVVSGLFGILLGSSWAAIAIVFPILLPAVFTFTALPELVMQRLFFVVIGAVLSGILLGSSLSPVNDLVVMNSKGCKISHASYLKIQFQYLLPIGLATLLGFLICGLMIQFDSIWISICSLTVSFVAANILFGYLTFKSKCCVLFTNKNC